MAKANLNADDVIRAAAYLRKSTAGLQTDGKERQEKSLPQQIAEVEKLKPALERRKYKVVRQYADPGKSGWKTGAARPDFARMLAECQQKKDIQAILVDDLDRFSRAEVGQVWTDIEALRHAGVRWIHAANQGIYDISDPADLGTIMKITVGAWSSNDFSRKLSRRITLARRNAAQAGKRSGGNAPYGMANNGDGGLTRGDNGEAKTVAWVFEQFVSQHRSLTSIARELNEQGTPAPGGGRWYVPTVSELLKRRAYRGDFEFNKYKSGRFHMIDENQNVVEASLQSAAMAEGAGVFLTEGVYEPLVPPALWDKAQERLASFRGGERKPRTEGFALAGILICDHCGRKMYGTRHNGIEVYRCKTNATHGAGCGSYEIREDRILPGILQQLGEEIRTLTNPPALHTYAPLELVEPVLWPEAARDEKTAELKNKAAAIKTKIDRAVEIFMDASDPRSRQLMDRKLNDLWTLHTEVEGEIAQLEVENGPGYTDDDIAKLSAWWDEFRERAVFMPLPDDPESNAYLYAKAWDADAPYGMHCDKQAVNDALHALGTELRLRWTTEKRKKYNRNKLAKAWLRLGQRAGELKHTVHAAANGGKR